MKSRLNHAIASALIAAFLSMGMPVLAEAGIAETRAAADRTRIMTALDREKVRARLVAYGVDPAEARARVAALTYEEATQLAAQMDALAVGGGVEGFFAVFFIAAYVLAMLAAGAVRQAGKA